MFKYNTNASEELKQGGFDFDLGQDFHYIKIGATNVGQLSKAGILPKKVYSQLSKNKPDGLIVYDKNHIKVLIEYKNSGKIRSFSDALKLIPEWYFELAKKINCNVICASDGSNTYWIYAPNKKIIRKSDNDELRAVLDVSKLCSNQFKDEKLALIEILKQLQTLDDDAIIKSETSLNPHALARNVWQKIWISTGKEPEKCLYNVVEIFIFKFLSDLGILSNNYSFNHVYILSLEGKDEALKHYAKTIRDEIREMFPKSSKDNTTIINGTIFVNEDGKPNIAQSTLFNSVIQQFADYDKEFGSFKNIDKNFKTRLYESFLRQSAGISALGQYFTPRNVVKAIVKMANGDMLSDSVIVGDPFCGVGGFVLELLNEYPKLKSQFEPKDGRIQPKMTLIGYDKGSDEKDDQRTIILAKANMLIYFSDLLVKNKNATKLFSERVFNQVFHLIKSNLGTLGIDEENKFDLILTNPPYVTSGVSAIKKEIEINGLSHIYPSGGNGLEGLALEWIIYSLKEGGTAFIVVPDGLLSRQSDAKLRQKILDSCIVNGIISLPTRTFFATPKITYILSITKKNSIDKSSQKTPIFTYLVSEIGETRDSKRFEIFSENDLIEMARLYRQFIVAPDDFHSTSLRCRIQPATRLHQKHWLINRDWNEDEKKELGLVDETTEISEKEFYKFIEEIGNVSFASSEISCKFLPVELSKIGDFFKGKSIYTAKYCHNNPGEYPVYSADTKGDLTIGHINTFDYDIECIRITTNGAYAGTVSHLKKQKFSLNGDAGIFVLNNNQIDYGYLEYALRSIRIKYGYGWENKPKKEELLSISIPIPINDDGSYDIESQQKIAKRYQAVENKKSEAIEMLKRILNTQISVIE